MSQSQPLRIENSQYGSFGTCRTINSLLWFANNQALEKRVLGRLAQYKEKYGIDLYAFVIQGNHFHPLARFSKLNRAGFYRDLNARTAEAVRALVSGFPGGPLFERRYSEQALPLPADIEDRFFYCALQPVSAGLVERISDYPGYNSFGDAIAGIKRQFKVVDWGKYRAARRYNPEAAVADFTHIYTLEYDRLPGYEHLTQKDYKKLMLKKFEERRVRLVNDLKAAGHIFPSPGVLKKTKPGTAPFQTKKSGRYDRRPLVLSVCQEAKKLFLQFYFAVYAAYKKASQQYLSGNAGAVFPPGTYKPPLFLVPT